MSSALTTVVVFTGVVIVAHCVYEAVLRWIDELIEHRREFVERQIAAFSYSPRYEPVIPVLRGMIDELKVIAIEVDRNDGNIVEVKIILTWWGMLIWWDRNRLMKKTEELMEKGGIYQNDRTSALSAEDQ